MSISSNGVEYCSVAEACRIAGVSDGYMRRLLRDKKIAGEKVGNTYLVLRSSLQKFERQPGMGRPRNQQGIEPMVQTDLYDGLVRDFGEYWAHITRVFSGSPVGVSLDRSGHGVMNHDECHRLGCFLIAVSEWLKFQPKPDGLPDGCVVYVIGDGCSHYKVGKAVNVRKRVKELQTGNPKKLFLAAFVQCPDEPTAMRVESLAHRAIGEFRSAGEWFECDLATAMSAVSLAASSHGIEHPVISFQSGETHGR